MPRKTHHASIKSDRLVTEDKLQSLDSCPSAQCQLVNTVVQVLQKKCDTVYYCKVTFASVRRVVLVHSRASVMPSVKSQRRDESRHGHEQPSTMAPVSQFREVTSIDS